MTFNEKIQMLLKIYTRAVTGIFLFLCFYLYFLCDNAMISVRDIVAIHLIGIISAATFIPRLTDNEFSKTQLIVSNLFCIVIINTSVLVFGYFLDWFSFKNKTILGLEFMVFGIYAIMSVIEYKIDNNSAKRMNKKIQERNIRKIDSGDEEKFHGEI